EYRAAIFPSRGYLDLESYGKLVVFTLRGGSLVTLPQPPTRQTDGTPFRSTFLWPHLPASIRRLDRARLLADLLRRRAAPLRGTILEWATESGGIAAVARGLVPRPEAASPTTGSANKATTFIRGDYLVAEFPDAA